jgi:D-glycero-D-manno-heptose 1,7-bisphosphate phosphatase
MKRYEISKLISDSNNFTTNFGQPVVGLGRDGTILKNIGKFLTHPNEVDPILGSLEAIKFLKEKGHKVVILTNQSGISKGLQTMDQVESVNKKMLDIFGNAGIRSIDGIYYSTSSLKEDIYAKPNIGMFQRSKDELKLDWKKGWYVGDKITDLKAADKVGAKPVLVLTGQGQETLKKLDTYANRDLKKKTLVFNNLLEFVKTI